MPPTDAELLRAFLSDRDAACPVCGYNLRGVSEGRCPECGYRSALVVSAPDARLGPWLLATLAFALALGFDGVGSLLACIPMVINGPPALSAAPEYWMAFSSLIVLGLASLGGLLVMLRLRPWWQRRPVSGQWARAGAVFLVVFLFHAAGGVLAVL
jgi:hypothetical protein